MPSRRHQQYLTFTGKLALATTALAVALLLVYEFWPGVEQHQDELEAHPAPPPDLVRLDDLKPLENRLQRLEIASRDRERLQREAINSILEAKIRLRTLEDQLGMLRVNSDSVRVGVDEIRDLLKEHVIRSRPMLEEFNESQRTPPPQPERPIVPGTVH
jgi:hypothetical protein